MKFNAKSRDRGVSVSFQQHQMVAAASAAELVDVVQKVTEVLIHVIHSPVMPELWAGSPVIPLTEQTSAGVSAMLQVPCDHSSAVLRD